MTEKYTKKDNYSFIRDYIERDGEMEPEIQERLLAFIDHELDLMSQRNEKAKKYQKQHNAAEDDLSRAIFDVLQNATEPVSTKTICELITGATPQKVTYRMSKLFDQGLITKNAQSIKDDTGVTRKIMVYQLIKN